MRHLVLPGCCVSWHGTLEKGDAPKYVGGLLSKSNNIAILVLHEKEHANFADLLFKDKVPFEKLNDGLIQFVAPQKNIKEALEVPATKALRDFEKKEGRRRDELRVGDIVTCNDIWKEHTFGVTRARVIAYGSVSSGENLNVIAEVIASNHKAIAVGQRLENYGTGFAPELFNLVIPGSLEEVDK